MIVVFDHQRDIPSGMPERYRCRIFNLKRDGISIGRTNGQPHSKDRAITFRTGYRHCSPVQFGELLHHGQPETGSFKPSGQAAVDLAKGPKQFRHIVHRNTDPGVSDRQLDELVELAFSQGKGLSGPTTGDNPDGATADPLRRKRDHAIVPTELHRV